MDSMYPICKGEEGGFCESLAIDLDALEYSPSSVDQLSVTMHPDGHYAKWVRNGLLDILTAAAQNVAKCESGTHLDPCFVTTIAPTCPSESVDYTNCEVPRYWYVAYTGDDQDDSDTPSYIEVGLEVENLGDGGLCEKVLEDGAALVGMFSELFSDYRSLEALVLTC